MSRWAPWWERAAAVLVVLGLAYVLGIAVVDQWNLPTYQSPWGDMGPERPLPDAYLRHLHASPTGSPP